jgi:tetratricopeptide (TPR) repeat protein
MTLQFGYGNEVTQTIDVDLHAATAGTYDGLVEQVWAQKRIAELDVRYEQNKDEITRLGKKYKVVTRNTSLIVLDRVEDYVTHHIVPPAELRQEYDKQIAAIEQTKTGTEQAHMDEVVQLFKEREDWWKTAFNPPPVVAHKPTTMHAQDGYASGQGSAMGAPAPEPMPDVAPVVQSEAFHATLSNSNAGSATYSVTVADASGASTSFNETAAPLDTQERRRDNPEDGKEVTAVGSSMQLAEWDPATPYLAKLKATEKSRWFKTYIGLKQMYEHQPSFYIDVADFFIKNNEPKMGLRVLSNIAELDLENPQLLRILGHRLEQLKYYDLSISVFKEVKNLRPEEPQSYRDLGLVYALNNEDQQAVDELYYVVSHSWDSRFSNIESLVAVEMNTIIARSTQDLDVSTIDPRLIASLPVDMRVVINWNADNCDIDLWVTDPRGEKCFYSNPLTAAGGRISNDFTQGYGPEEFVIKKAIPGNYVIEANYYGNSSQALSGPTTIQVQMITNYGRKTQKTKEVTRRLESEKEVIKLATFAFKPQ